MPDTDQTTVYGRDRPAFFFMSSHGGAGATTLATLIAPGGDVGQSWPTREVNPYVYLVASASVETLDKALQILGSAPREVIVLGVVIVHDSSGKLSRAVVNKLKVIRNRTHVFEAPFLKEVRETPLAELPEWTPSEQQSGRRLRSKNTLVQKISPLANTLCQRFVDLYTAVDEENLDKEKENTNV